MLLQHPTRFQTIAHALVMALVAIGLQASYLLPVATAGGGPENTLVVVNGESDSSKLIANHYISLRKIPSRNVVYLEGLPFKESVSHDLFREQILMPILQQLNVRKLVGSIDYIVYSSDIPTSIEVKDYRKLLVEESAKQGSPISKDQLKLYNPTASITSLTFFAGQIVRRNPSFLLLNSNRYYRQSSDAVLRKPFVGQAMKDYQSAVDNFKFPADENEFKEAVKTLEELAQTNPGQTAVHYWLAKFYVKKDNIDQATRYMTRAIRMGWNDRGRILADPDFETARDNPLFKGTVDRIENGGRFLASRGFRQLHPWAPNGMLNHANGQGERYFLSTVLAVTRNDGLTESEAVNQLRVSAAADFKKPKGIFYFCDTKDVRATTRKPNFTNAIESLEQLGYRSETINTKMPDNQAAVLGLTSGTPTFDWKSTKSTIVHGAICENLTSFGGRIGMVGGQTKLTEFLRYGAAGSSGTVTEPFAIQAKFPHPMVHVHYVRGCSLAESFYQSIQGPFQTLIVGDALCQPFATPPVLRVYGIRSTEKLSGKVQLSISDNNSPVPVAGVELFVNGVLARRDSSLDPIDLDTRLLPDGYHELRVVGVADNLIETRCRSILPIEVDNEGFSTSLTIGKDNFDMGNEIEFTAKSNFGSKISIVHNRRELGVISSLDGTCSIKASDIGRGPVEIRAVAIDDTSEPPKMVSSRPVKLTIQGLFATERPVTAVPRPKTKSRK
jgi:tetratricopeptide (TPR) repeat protein